MRLTQFTDYAYRALIYLAMRPDELCTVQEISDCYKLSKNHLMKVIQKLGQTGFVETIRGKGGGLRLAHPASEINIGAVARAMEGPLCVVECMGDNSACKIESGCILKSALTRAANAFFNILDEYSLEDITKRKSELGRLLFTDAA
ncbi:Rrf2 family transcriptional regulator [Curvivirga aplysinae]|uniref:Rrf2 family transcriptional regulator n=1 Tax=Curvivirga aplysinae TaxID=2529852 RepID=UPI0012BB7793|nr:Rrf2 family transcriptional regulator [Curvivirga aplysinae]MTI08643.1 Rrf2 family transcriptional regulator [Curvivirga aplysinae]